MKKTPISVMERNDTSCLQRLLHMLCFLSASCPADYIILVGNEVLLNNNTPPFYLQS